MKTRNVILPAILTAVVFFAVSCSKDKDTKPKDDQPVAKTVVVQDLPADPVEEDPDGGRPAGGTGHYTLFRFSDSTIVANSDSASAKWDIGFHSTTIIVNNTLHGPGAATAQLLENKLFDDVIDVPATNYRADSADANVFGGWYNYNGETHVVSPKPGYVYIIHTNDGHYVKMQISSYYKGSSEENPSRYYTFKYVYTSGDKFTGEE